MKKVLVVNPFGIGDVIFSFYAIATLKKARPDIRIDFFGNERTVSLARMNPDLSRIYEFNRDKLRAVRAKSFFKFLKVYRTLIADWKREEYDAMFDLSLGREFSFLGKMSGIPRRFGLDYKGRGLFLTDKTNFKGYEGRPVSETQLDLFRRSDSGLPDKLSAIRWNISEVDTAKAEELLAGEDSWMVLAPGGGHSWGQNAVYKQWDADKFVVSANHWAREGGGILLLGDASERALLERIQGGLRVKHIVACGESLGVVAALLQRCRLFLGNDGGLLHLAHSLAVPSVSVFGPVDEKAYGPYGTDARREVVTATVSCRPCYQSFHFPPCPNERRCLTEISVQKVLESVDKIA